MRWAELRMCRFWAGGISSFPFSRAREYRLLRRLVKTRKPINCCYFNILNDMFSNNKQRSAIYSQQITILGLISIFRANIYYFETDFCEDFCSLLVAIGQSSQEGTFYAKIIAAILSHPPVFFFRIFNKLRIFSVPVFRVPE